MTSEWTGNTVETQQAFDTYKEEQLRLIIARSKCAPKMLYYNFGSVLDNPASRSELIDPISIVSSEQSANDK